MHNYGDILTRIFSYDLVIMAMSMLSNKIMLPM